MPHLLLPLAWRALTCLKTPLPPVGRQGLTLSSRGALHFSWQQEGEWNSQLVKASLASCHSCSLACRASFPMVFREGSEKGWSSTLPPQPPVLRWKQREGWELWSRQGQATCLAWGAVEPPCLLLGTGSGPEPALHQGLCLSLETWLGLEHCTIPHPPVQPLLHHGHSPLGRSLASL